MKIKLKDKIRYRFENFMAKGGISIFIALLILFFGAMIFSIIIRSVILFFDPAHDIFKDFLSHLWIVFLEITDPGSVADEVQFSIAFKVIGITTIMLGLVIFSMLIAFITTQVEQMIYNFRRGKSRVLESGHTLIVGWNERLFDIIRELIIANESEKKAVVVILADEDKEMMDDMILKEITSPKTTDIVTRSGNTSSMKDLDRVSVKNARSVIILSSCSDSASYDMKSLSDIKTIKTILAITEGDLENAKCTIIAEIFTEEKRKIINSFNSDKIIAINTWDILGKLLVQTSLTSGLAVVYSEMLSFDGCEVYYSMGDYGNIPF